MSTDISTWRYAADCLTCERAYYFSSSGVSSDSTDCGFVNTVEICIGNQTEENLAVFAPGIAGLSEIHSYSDNVLHVCHHGALYLIETGGNLLLKEFIDNSIQLSIRSESSNLCFYVNYTDIYCIDGCKVLWSAMGMSSDGFRNIVFKDGVLRGLAWDAPSNADKRFSIDAIAGVVLSESD